MPEKMMLPWQRSRIYGLAKELGMSTKSDDGGDDLHLVINSRTGKKSLKMVTFDEANKIIGELSHRQRFEPSKPEVEKFQFVEVPGKMSYGQYRKIVALMCELRKLDPAPSNCTIEQRVAGLARKYMHMDVSDKNPYSWFSSYKAGNLIECIKGVLETERGRAESRRESG